MTSWGSSPLTRGKHAARVNRRVEHGLIPAHAGKTIRSRGVRTPPRAHPRSRGENRTRRAFPGSPAGSSPLTRGKRPTRDRSRTGSGLIPAHAGKTAQYEGIAGAKRAHPRSRGENQSTVAIVVDEPGSSPLTRGKHPRHHARRIRARLIPAHAGKTATGAGRHSWRRAHPRSRGENFPDDCVHVGVTGSSPLTRGKRDARVRRKHGPGLIPAHAGKTAPNGIKNFADGAHPRSRGENTPAIPRRQSTAGSSPLTRGKPWGDEYDAAEHRLIPAHAGKTAAARACAVAARAHPRSRGENNRSGLELSCALGSSPLTRGKPGTSPPSLDRAGLIPAHAGKTQQPTCYRVRARAHPRSRGENVRARRWNFSHAGSSPLTRGKLAWRISLFPYVGLIPTHAGKTVNLKMLETDFGAHPHSRGENSP